MPNRYVCSAIEELRDHIKKLKVFMKAKFNNEELELRIQFQEILIEEIQTYVNRMEAGLEDKWSIHREQEKLVHLKADRRDLNIEIKKLTEKKAEVTAANLEEEIKELQKEIAKLKCIRNGFKK
jgi:chromosome segregation ATPase